MLFWDHTIVIDIQVVQDFLALNAGLALMHGSMAIFTRPGAIVNPDIDSIVRFGWADPWSAELQRYITMHNVPLPPIYLEFAEWWRCLDTVDMQTLDLIGEFRHQGWEAFLCQTQQVCLRAKARLQSNWVALDWCGDVVIA